MPAVCRLGDNCTGHGSWPPRQNVEGSADVFVNGIAAHRIGDAWIVHCNPLPSCHGSTLGEGSSSVFVNGKALGRVGDAVVCGSSIAEGSPTVFAGG